MGETLVIRLKGRKPPAKKKVKAEPIREQSESVSLEGSSAHRLRKNLKLRYKIYEARNPFKDGEYPVLPRDITRINDIELSTLYGQFSAYGEYVHDVAAGYEVEFILSENDSKIEDALERLRLHEDTDNKRPKHVKEDIAFVEEGARKKRAHKLEMKSMYKILQAKLDAIDRNIRALSREQTRREKEYEHRLNKTP